MLVRNKVATFIIVGGQDNIQAVAGQLLAFFAELGFLFPQFPFVAHSRGWSAEDMEQNVAVLKTSRELREGAEQLVGRALAWPSIWSGSARPRSESSAGAARPTG